MPKTLFYDWGGLNVWLFHLINDIHTPWLDSFMRLGTALGDHANFPHYLAIVAVIACCAPRRAEGGGADDAARKAFLWPEALAVFALAFVLDGWLLDWLKPYLDFPRPLLALPANEVTVVGVALLHHGLPSGHASFAMLVAASLWPVLKPPHRIAMGLFVSWVGLSRVSVGAHFPADVLAGFISCLALVLLVRASVRRLCRRDAVSAYPTARPYWHRS